MQVFERAGLLTSFIENQKKQNHSVGFVPTMGALHRGHLSLVKHALRENDLVVVSIFVNPTQFNNAADLQKYPRVPEVDLKLLREAQTDVVFLPPVKEIYPNGTQSEEIDLNGLDRHMEGQFRPGHFQGVVTVVKRFFNIVKPTRAYFGEKDYQQLQIIRHMTQLHKLNVEIVSHPVERGPGGLALSSRNELMSLQQKEEAGFIHKALQWAQKNYRDFNPRQLQEALKARFEKSNLKLEYALVSDPESLEPLEEWSQKKGARLFIAAYMGEVRLIDNVPLF